MRSLTILLFSIAMSCKVQASNYCEDAPFHNCKDLLVDAAPTCSANAECTAPTSVCDVAGTKQCVACTAASHDACSGATPVCDDSHACRGCETHAECPSAVCLLDGSCAESTQVAYVNGAASAAATGCTLTAPCRTVTIALAANRPIVKLTGTVDDHISITNRTVKLFAEPTSKLTSSSAGPLVAIAGTSVVELHGLHIVNALGDGMGYGVLMQPLFAGTVSMFGGSVSDSDESGIMAHGGSLIVEKAKVLKNGGPGISVAGGTVRVAGTMVLSNRGGGISVKNATFDITNSIIADNGDSGVAGSVFGGVELVSSNRMSRFAHNTVVLNHQMDGGLGAAGVTCIVNSFTATGNIITSNDQGAQFIAQTGGTCTFPSSYVVPHNRENV